MIEITTVTFYIYIVSYMIVFISGLIFMDKYFKWKTKYQIMLSDIELLFVFSELWEAIWEIAGMDEAYKKGKAQAKKTHKKETTKKSTKKVVK